MVVRGVITEWMEKKVISGILVLCDILCKSSSDDTAAIVEFEDPVRLESFNAVGIADDVLWLEIEIVV